jgi:thioesterase domain-containing protein
MLGGNVEQTHELVSEQPHGSVDLTCDAPVSVAVPPLWRLVSRRTSPIANLNPGGRGLPFYCVHSIGGDVTKFYRLAQALGSEQPFYGIQVPKDKMTAAFASSIEGIARHYVETLIAFQPEGKIVLGGWSVGAIIALEMAQKLRAIGRDVPLLVAIDGAPCNTGGGISPWNPRYGWRLICNIPRWLRDDQQQSWSWRAFSRRIVRKFNFHTQVSLPALGSRQTLHGDAVDGLLSNDGWSTGQTSFMRALFTAGRDYIPQPYPGRVVVYEARTQPLWHLLQVGAAWTKVAERPEVVVLKGGHTSLVREPAIGALAQHLRTILATASTCEG